jgi:hypothetical protein
MIRFRASMFKYLLDTLKDGSREAVLAIGHGLTVAAFLDDEIDTLTTNASDAALRKIIRKRSSPT